MVGRPKQKKLNVSAPVIKQLPLAFGKAHKGDVRTQFAALCYRVKNDKVQVLLVTSRRSGRWIIPKGWPMNNTTPYESAAQEAWEEAGVVGRVDTRPLGMYSYVKEIGDESGLPCVAMVFPMKVTSLAKDYPEQDERTRKWVTRKKAAVLVNEPELARIIKDFDPRVWY